MSRPSETASSKYDFVDKRFGFYATDISFFHCSHNEFAFNRSSPCIAFKFCPSIEKYENVLLEPSGFSTNCQKYAADYWQPMQNDYILFQASFVNTDLKLMPELFLVFTSSSDPMAQPIAFGNEFSDDFRTLLLRISPFNKSISIKTKHSEKTLYSPQLFANNSQIEWFWMHWSANFDFIKIGNGKRIIDDAPLFTLKYSQFFRQKLKRNENHFKNLNLAWSAAGNKCYGLVIVQFAQLNTPIAKGCYEEDFNFTNLPQTTTQTPISSTKTTQKIDDGNGDNDDGIQSSPSSQDFIVIVFGSLLFVVMIVGVSVAVIRKKITIKRERNENENELKTVDLKYQRMEDNDDYL